MARQGRGVPWSTEDVARHAAAPQMCPLVAGGVIAQGVAALQAQAWVTLTGALRKARLAAGGAVEAVVPLLHSSEDGELLDHSPGPRGPQLQG
mmetsp:Transcript_2514/g.4567  ORF Transcript_2514/g.4567 Transcript_2514/m.4567 type:complete len:93 (+) Transcript_2514:337-615(+)